MSSPTNPLRPDQINPLKGVQATQETESSGSGNFAEMMSSTASKATASTAPSPMNVLPGTNPVSGPSYNTMQSGLSTAQSHLNDMQTQLQTPGLRIMPQDRDLLAKNLSNATDQLHAVNNKLGVTPSPTASTIEGPLGRFIGLINNGSEQITSAKQQLATIASTPDSLNPAEMLMVQVKINQAQQQIEFSSVLLSKVVDDFKQLMNIQI